MIVYRMCLAAYAATTLEGEGARLYGGRWNPKGVRMVYAASSLALGALESFVHFSSARLPADYVSIAVEIPETIAVETWTVADLPVGWDLTPAPSVLQEMGAAWVRSGRTAVLRVPSAVVRGEFNVLLNPAHADAGQVQPRAPEPFVFDPRLIKPPEPAPRPRNAKAAKEKTPAKKRARRAK